MSDKNLNNNDLTDHSLVNDDLDFSDTEGFVDFIDQNFEEIKIAGCTRDSCYIWICK